jgi:preprotein translocase subunit SecG
MKYSVEMASGNMINLTSFVAIVSSVCVMLSLLLQESESFSIGITDGKNL